MSPPDDQRDVIRALLSAKYDDTYYKQRGSMVNQRKRDAIYLRGDEPVVEDGSYIHVISECVDVYIPISMIQRLCVDTYMGCGESGDLNEVV